jgi:uncharacterized protein YecT (DUF1311 family)
VVCSTATVAQSQSFDCRLAKLPDEVAICQDPELGKLDSEMARLFVNYRALLKGSELQALTKDQSAWLSSRRACRSDAQCIRSKYEQRLSYLAAHAPGTGVDPAFEPPPDQSPIATVKYDGKKPSGLQYGDISLTVDSEPVAGGPERIPFVTGRYKGESAFTIRLNDGPDSYGQEEPAAAVSLMKIDPSTPAPQVVLSYFWGGAHCCTMTRIATVDAAGQWHVVDAGALDGEGYEFKDLDRDGGSELISVDNSFLYAFDCYACSYAPTRVQKLIGTALQDVTRAPRYQPFLRYQLRQMEKQATDNDQWHSNGFLGGWVASKSLVGELWDAWRTMLARYDRQSDWTMEECLTGAQVDKCPPDKLRKLNFPAALAKHLLSQGYITANEVQHLQVPGR